MENLIIVKVETEQSKQVPAGWKPAGNFDWTGLVYTTFAASGKSSTGNFSTDSKLTAIELELIELCQIPKAKACVKSNPFYPANEG